MANGAIVTGLNPDYNLDLKGNENLQVGNFVLTVDASIPRNIYLPNIAKNAKFGNGQFHLYIIKNGSEDITIYPSDGDSINGMPSTLVLGSSAPIITDIMIIRNEGFADLWVTSTFINPSSGIAVPPFRYLGNGIQLDFLVPQYTQLTFVSTDGRVNDPATEFTYSPSLGMVSFVGAPSLDVVILIFAK